MEFPVLPNSHALAMLLMTGVALFLFTRERIPLESSSLAILVMMVIGFEIFPFSGASGSIEPMTLFYGFGHEALVAVCALMIAGEALSQTGALVPVARRLARLWKWSPAFALLLTLIVGAVLSAFMNNTPIVVLMLPMLIGAAARNNSPTSGILLPMGFATLIGGMGTTIGTSTNLLVVSVAAEMGMAHFEMFDFLMPVAIAAGVAIGYLWLVAPRMIPERKPPMADISNRVFQAHLAFSSGNSLVGKPLAAIIHKARGIKVISIVRADNLLISPLPDVIIRPGDKILVSGTADMLREYEALLGARMLAAPDEEGKDEDGRGEEGTGEEGTGEEGMGNGVPGESGPDDPGAGEPGRAGVLAAAGGSAPQGDLKLAEVVVTGGSRLRGLRVSDAFLKRRYGLDLLAVHSAGDVTTTGTPGLNQHQLQASDVLLVQGRSADIRTLKVGGELLVLDSTMDLPHTSKAPLALLIMVMIVALAALGILPIAMSALLGCMVLIGTGCLNWQQATQALSTQVVLIIVASLALGSALMKTGGAGYVAEVFVFLTSGLAPAWTLAFLMLLMAVLTNVVSNNAAAVVGTPVAISIAQQLGLPLEPFVLAVLFGANLSFVTPMAYKTNLLVMNAGGYKFNDFVKVGTPLTLLMWVILTVVLAYAYGL